MKKLITPLLLVLATACGSTSLRSSSTTAYASTPSAPRARASYYILLSAPNQLRETSVSSVGGFHVDGNMNSRGFAPVSQVEGNGQFCADGKDWLDLATLTVHTASDGHAPAAPYLLGCAVSSGFQPASRDVVWQ